MLSIFSLLLKLKMLLNLNKKIRVGGMVKKNSVSMNSNEISFIITDFKNEINVIYTGAIPNLLKKEKV